jgi:uncharacterized protein
MPKNILIITIIIIISSLFLFWKLFFYLPSSSEFINLNIKDQKYKIELAKTSAQKIKGLSKRESLCKNCGMLFIFGFETDLPFWMKDTLIPLDMIWLNKDGKVVDIQTAATTSSQKIYRNKAPAQYVLELNANDCKKINLNIGDIIQLSKLNE